MKARVPPELGGRRTDLVLARLADVSRAVARSMVDAGDVLVDGGAASARSRIPAGASVEWEPPPPPPRLEPEPIEFGIVHEDEWLAVVDKPTGLVVHPGAGRSTGTLAAGLLHRWPGVEGVGDEGRWGIVHRLDRDTSGLMVVALAAEAYGPLKKAVAAHVIDRRYLALVHGRPSSPAGTIEAPLARDPGRPTRRRIDPRGRPAISHFEVIAAWPERTLLEVVLESGRTHQIRVHLSSIGLPVVGDGAYGRVGGAPRVFLHSHRLGFDHPVTAERVEAASSLPEDLMESIGALGVPETGAVPGGGH